VNIAREDSIRPLRPASESTPIDQRNDIAPIKKRSRVCRFIANKDRLTDRTHHQIRIVQNRTLMVFQLFAWESMDFLPNLLIWINADAGL
jgi:hypothetical protein